MMEDEIYKMAVSCWGKKTQSDMMIEEATELIQAILKDRRGKDIADNLIEEIVDTQIMLNQMRIIVNDESKYQRWMAYKLDKLQTLIEQDDRFIEACNEGFP